VRDAAGPVYERHAELTLQRLGEHDVAQLVKAHRQAPFGPHADDLARVLYFLRARDTVGKYVIVAVSNGWRLAKVTGQRTEGSIELEPEVYPSVEEAEHAAFTSRLHEIGLLPA
jgi:hypothetical protein